MTRRIDDTRTGELFDGPVVAGRELDPNYAIWLRDIVLPNALKFFSLLEDGGEMPAGLASQGRQAALYAVHKLNTESDDQ